MPTADAERIARLGAVLASPSRSAILSALMGGTAHTHVELGRNTGLAASSVSEHVGVLLRRRARRRRRTPLVRDAPRRGPAVTPPRPSIIKEHS